MYLKRVFSSFFFFQDFVCLFLERGGGRKKGRETSMCGCLSCAPCWEPCCNPGMCPDWESNQRPLRFCRLVLNPLSHTSQGSFSSFFFFFFKLLVYSSSFEKSEQSPQIKSLKNLHSFFFFFFASTNIGLCSPPDFILQLLEVVSSYWPCVTRLCLGSFFFAYHKSCQLSCPHQSGF